MKIPTLEIANTKLRPLGLVVGLVLEMSKLIADATTIPSVPTIKYCCVVSSLS